MVVELSVLPAGVRVIAEALPAAALSSAIHDAVGPTAGYSGCWVVLCVWAVLTPLVALATFRFEGD
jgi:hypothetical protein